MNPFAWVLFDRDGLIADALSDPAAADIGAAWIAFCERIGFDQQGEMQELGYRVLRCKLVEVGQA